MDLHSSAQPRFDDWPGIGNAALVSYLSRPRPRRDVQAVLGTRYFVGIADEASELRRFDAIVSRSA